MNSPLPVTLTRASDLLALQMPRHSSHSLRKKIQRLPNIYNWTCTETAVLLPSLHRLKDSVCAHSWGQLIPPMWDHLSSPTQRFFTECLDWSISEISSSEDKALSEVAEPQQSQSSFCKLQQVPAISNNSRYVCRKDTFRLISWEISLNTFSLLHHAEEHQSSREIYYILLEK